MIEWEDVWIWKSVNGDILHASTIENLIEVVKVYKEACEMIDNGS